jgi:hypothetical protein
MRGTVNAGFATGATTKAVNAHTTSAASPIRRLFEYGASGKRRAQSGGWGRRVSKHCIETAGKQNAVADATFPAESHYPASPASSI